MTTSFNVYCDESRHTSDPADRFVVLGALQCPRERKRELVHEIHLMQDKHRARGKFGWSKVAPGKAAFFEELADWFMAQPDLRFRALIADRGMLTHEVFNAGDGELGFYKMYYQMLVHWLQTYVKDAAGHAVLITDWRGRQVKFGHDAFRHAFTETARLREGLDHEIELSEIRAQRVLWIKEVLAGEAGLTRVYREQPDAPRGGRRKRRRVYYVVDERYVVVLDEPEDASQPMHFVTAFVTTDMQYEQQIKRKRGVLLEEKKASLSRLAFGRSPQFLTATEGSRTSAPRSKAKGKGPTATRPDRTISDI